VLRFIKYKMKHDSEVSTLDISSAFLAHAKGKDVVIFRDGKHLTLAQVFESLGLTSYDLSIDTLDMHAHQNSFHRFDRFNLKYSPIGESRLREIFLKTDNFIQGRYLAEITKGKPTAQGAIRLTPCAIEIFTDLTVTKYQMAEYRISVYGRSLDEWDKLAKWIVDHKLFSDNARWLVQVPRLYDQYKKSGLVDSFQDVLISLSVALDLS
jgi:AMP deaminase